MKIKFDYTAYPTTFLVCWDRGGVDAYRVRFEKDIQRFEIAESKR